MLTPLPFQRELSESSERDDVLGSLMEADEAVSAPTNVSSSEAMDVKDVAEAISEPMDDEADGEHQWNRDATPKKTIDMADAEFEEDMDISTSPQQQHLFYDDLFCSSQWSPYRYDSSGWNYLSSTSSSNGGGFGGGLASSSSGQSASAASSSFFSSGSFIEDYLSVWGGFENESDSLQHHNLSQVDIMHMFGSPRSPHQHQLNNELISQA
uniref:Ovule protein n=1 Tax=Steinernema glaseri TaxID=37863 RepID=A0A1I7YLU7_9BILA